MNPATDFVALLSLTGHSIVQITDTTKATEVVERYLCSVAQELENRTNNCPHCGTKLKPWEPQVLDFKLGLGTLYTTHKWCGSCCGVTYNRLVGLMGLPDKYTV